VVTEFTGGVTAGFSANGVPVGIADGPDGNLWFTEFNNPGRVARITPGPGAVTGAATGIGPNSATLNGTVRPNGQLTVYRFEYGTTTAYGSQTTPASAGAGVAPVAASQAIAGLAPDTLYHYRLTATNNSDTTLGADRTFTTAPAGGGATPLAVLSGLRISPTAFRAARSGPSARAAARRRGAIVSFRLDRAASVRFRVERALKGRRVGRRCVKPERSNRRRRGCTRYRRLRGSFTRAGAAGRNRFRFTGRFGGRTLRPGRYRLVATPRAGTRSGKPKRAHFRIKR
jgi:hypothetical protein